MNESAQPGAAPAAEGMSEAGRLAGVFFSPSQTFADIAARPKWIVPLLLVMVMSLGFVQLYTQHIGWDFFIDNELANNPRIANLEPAARQQVLDQQRKFVPIMGYVGPALFLPIGALVIAAVLMFLFNTLKDAGLKFKNYLGIVTYSWFAPGLVGTALAVLVMYLKPKEDFNLQNPTAFNVGAFLPADTSAAMKALGTSLDLFTIWTIVLLTLGVQAARPRKSFGDCLGPILGGWIVMVLCKMGWAAMFG